MTSNAIVILVAAFALGAVVIAQDTKPMSHAGGALAITWGNTMASVPFGVGS